MRKLIVGGYDISSNLIRHKDIVVFRCGGN